MGDVFLIDAYILGWYVIAGEWFTMGDDMPKWQRP